MNNNNPQNHPFPSTGHLIPFPTDCIPPVAPPMAAGYSTYTPVVHLHGHFYIPAPNAGNLNNNNLQQQQHFIVFF